MNALSLLSELVKAIVLFINPKQNMTTVQRVGSFLSILTLLGMLAGAVNALLPVDVPTPQNPAQDVLPVGDVYPDVPGDESASVGILGLLGAAVTAPLGCSSAQVAGWQAFGVGVADCLVNKCGLASDVVAGMQSGAWGELLSDNLPCALVCLGSAAGDVIVKRGEVKQVATWFGTSNEVRVVEVYRVRIQKVPYN